MIGPQWPLSSVRNKTHLHVGDAIRHIGALTAEECDRAVNEGQALGLKSGGLDEGRLDQTVRRSRIGFFQAQAHRWLYDTVGAVVREMNQKHFGFELVGLETIQYCEYRADDQGYYDVHRDVFPDTIVRKLSFSIQLSDPSEYDGADLQLFIHKLDQPIVANRDRGHGLLFPSWTMHRVTPATRGVRRALVTWAVGPEFR